MYSRSTSVTDDDLQHKHTASTWHTELSQHLINVWATAVSYPFDTNLTMVYFLCHPVHLLTTVTINLHVNMFFPDKQSLWLFVISDNSLVLCAGSAATPEQ